MEQDVWIKVIKRLNVESILRVCSIRLKYLNSVISIKVIL